MSTDLLMQRRYDDVIYGLAWVTYRLTGGNRPRGINKHFISHATWTEIRNHHPVVRSRVARRRKIKAEYMKTVQDERA